MDWPYQYDIGFQYSYGSVTLLFLMALFVYRSIKQEPVGIGMAVGGFISFFHHFQAPFYIVSRIIGILKSNTIKKHKNYFDGLERWSHP